MRFADDPVQQENLDHMEMPGVDDTAVSKRKPGISSAGVNLKRKINKFFLMLFAVAVGGFMIWSVVSEKMADRKAYEEAQQNIETGKTVNQTLPAIRLPERTPPPAPVTITPSGDIPAPKPSYIGRDPLADKDEMSPEDMILMRKKISSVTFALGSDQLSSRSEYNEQGQWAAAQGSDTLSQNLVSAVTVKAIAQNLGDRNFIMSKGTFIEAVLTTAISSDVVGMVKATVTQDVYSANGKVCLLERGTHLIGEYQAGLTNGQSRLFLLWTRAETPKGVVVDLNSPAADELGRSGADGEINTHFWKRFGYGFLISTWSDLMQMLIDSQRDFKGDDNNITYDNSMRAAQDMAVETLKYQINIPPTLEKNQGEPIRVFVARDLDFSKVYRLSFRQASHRQ